MARIRDVFHYRPVAESFDRRQIGSGAEIVAGPYNQHYADCLAVRGLTQRAPNLGDHFMIERVALFGTVERDTSDTLVNRVQNFARVAHLNGTGILPVDN